MAADVPPSDSANESDSSDESDPRWLLCHDLRTHHVMFSTCSRCEREYPFPNLRRCTMCMIKYVTPDELHAMRHGWKTGIVVRYCLENRGCWAHLGYEELFCKDCIRDGMSTLGCRWCSPKSQMSYLPELHRAAKEGVEGVSSDSDEGLFYKKIDLYDHGCRPPLCPRHIRFVKPCMNCGDLLCGLHRIVRHKRCICIPCAAEERSMLAKSNTHAMKTRNKKAKSQVGC